MEQDLITIKIEETAKDSEIDSCSFSYTFSITMAVTST